MSLPLIDKITWKIKNHTEVFLQKFKKSELPSGCLSHRLDPRDILFGASIKMDRPKHSIFTMSNDIWRYSQNPFNTCVFASGVMGASHQEGKRFSIRFAVQLARKLGMITGNGFSYLRAMREISIKYGRLPYEMMPDEINGMSWQEYSSYQITDEMMREAAKWKAPSYKKITNASEAILALEMGYALFSANDWYQTMNYPQPDDYYLSQGGRKVGAHAWFVGNYRSQNGFIKDYQTVQSFGFYYGEEGKARLKSLFGKGHFEVYIEEKIPGRTDLERVLGVYEGKCISGYDDPGFYKVEYGKKRGFVNWEAYTKAGKPKCYEIPMELVNLIPDGELIY